MDFFGWNGENLYVLDGIGPENYCLFLFHLAISHNRNANELGKFLFGRFCQDENGICPTLLEGGNGEGFAFYEEGKIISIDISNSIEFLLSPNQSILKMRLK